MAEHESFEAAQNRIAEILGERINRPVEEMDGWHFGERVRLVEDTDMGGAGEEGWLILEVVGSAQYRNERTVAGILLDGTDVPDEVSLDLIESAA